MITLPFRLLRTPVPELASSSLSFDRPVACYARHRDDAEYVLPAAAVFDFQDGCVTWFDPHSPENRKILSEVPGNPFGIGKDRVFDPHWFVRIGDGSYLMFFQRRRYVYRFRPESRQLDALFPEDLGLPAEVDEFWATNCLHEDGSVTFLVHETYSNRNRYSIYRSDPAFTKFELVHSGHTKSGNIPHVIVPYGDGYLLSDFYYNEFRFSNDPQKRKFSEEDVLTAAYSGLFAKFREGRPYAEIADFLKNTPKGLAPVDAFRDFVRGEFAKGGFKSVKEYCDTTRYAFVPFPGEITYVRPKEWTERVFETTCSNPAHFEVDQTNGDVYVSSHNFNYINRTVLEYFWPAAIDRFVPDSREFLKKAETFSVPEGFRFTSHRIVESGGTRFVVTFWQPNRFFSIPVPELRGHSCLDVGSNAISEFSTEPSAMLRYLRRDGGDESVTIKAVEGSVDGSGRVLAVSGTDALVLCVDDTGAVLETRIAMPFPEDSEGNPGAEAFKCRTTHLNYVR